MSAKSEHSARASLRVPRDWWPDVAIGLIAFVAVGLLPLALGGYVHERGFAQYALLWRELIGEAGRLPLETPKPFTTLRAALGYGPYYGLAALLFAAAPVALGRLSYRLYGTRLVGVGAVILLLLANSYFLPGPVLTGYWPLSYLGMMAVSLWAFSEGRYALALGSTAIAGLIRPDAWGYAVLLMALIALLDRKAWRHRYFTALFCIPAWLLFDYVLSGQLMYSAGTLAEYLRVTGVPPTTPGIFWQRVAHDVSETYVAPLLIAGIVGLASGAVRASRESTAPASFRRGHAYGVGLVTTGVLGYWALSGLTDGFVFHVRFLVLPLLLLHFYALALPLETLNWRTARHGGLRETGRRSAQVLAIVTVVGTAVLGWEQRGAWAGTKEAHRIHRLKGKARSDAIAYLRQNWMHTDESLLSGRSISVFAYRLGPEAARRMHLFRGIAEDREQLPALAPGLAVYIGHDIAGANNWFSVLRRGAVVNVRRLNVRFEPRVALKEGEETLGVIYRFRSVDLQARSTSD